MADIVKFQGGNLGSVSNVVLYYKEELLTANPPALKPGKTGINTYFTKYEAFLECNERNGDNGTYWECNLSINIPKKTPAIDTEIAKLSNRELVAQVTDMNEEIQILGNLIKGGHKSEKHTTGNSVDQRNEYQLVFTFIMLDRPEFLAEVIVV